MSSASLGDEGSLQEASHQYFCIAVSTLYHVRSPKLCCGVLEVFPPPTKNTAIIKYDVPWRNAAVSDAGFPTRCQRGSSHVWYIFICVAERKILPQCPPNQRGTKLQDLMHSIRSLLRSYERSLRSPSHRSATHYIIFGIFPICSLHDPNRTRHRIARTRERTACLSGI